jgi:outer membrane protein OmpA-like peptidoglycan-associated protein
MHTKLILSVAVLSLSSLIACAHSQPSEELLLARIAYDKAAAGPATDLDPADLHEARVALDNAENMSKDDPQANPARQQSYLALRRAELADASGKTAAAEKARAQTMAQEQAVKDQQLANAKNQVAIGNSQLASAAARNQHTQNELSRTQGKLDDQTAATQETQAQLDAERLARVAAEQKAMDAVAKWAQVKEEERGSVITLSGSVIFASGQSVLLPSAQRKLADVVEALRNDSRAILIEGHTDSSGKVETNQSLSQARADSVMSFLVSRDVPSARMQAVGLGSTRSIANNASAEGRANNRRVEIILQRPQTHAENR